MEVLVAGSALIFWCFRCRVGEGILTFWILSWTWIEVALFVDVFDRFGIFQYKPR